MNYFQKGMVLMAMVLLGGCMPKEKVHIPKEGEIVTWKFTDQLIIKAELGQRRKHIPDTHCTKCEREFYRPHLEHYLGQFPIDYQPKKYPSLSESEAKETPWTMIDMGGGLEFNLILNGSTVQATDNSIHGNYTLDHYDQVKVFVSTLGGSTERNTKQFFDSEIMKNLNIDSKQTQNGVDCYQFNNGSKGKMCFGNSMNALSSGFQFYVSPDHNFQLFVRSQEFILGGVKVNWIVDQKHFDNVQEIDANIWRLLMAWNISPVDQK